MMWCPVCKDHPMADYLDKYGDRIFYCTLCKQYFTRYGFQGPLCVKEI